jgi:hypothetical protein
MLVHAFAFRFFFGLGGWAINLKKHNGFGSIIFKS